MRSSAASFSVSGITLICRARPPMTRAWPTPRVDSICRLTTLSANSVISRIGAGPESAIERTGAASVSSFCTIGGSAAVGNSARIVLTLSRTSCAATSPFFSRSNRMETIEMPSDEIDWSSSMPLIVLTASSILSVTSVSISSGLAPTRTVVTVTRGKSTLGKRSTPRVK